MIKIGSYRISHNESDDFVQVHHIGMSDQPVAEYNPLCPDCFDDWLIDEPIPAEVKSAAEKYWYSLG